METFRDLTEQQNRSGLIANGILMSPENPTITNLYTSMIIPMSWACSLRVKLSDRDLMLETINALIDELKGSKVDIAELKCRDDQGRAIYVPFAVGTIGHDLGTPTIKCGDYIGDFDSETPTNAQIDYRLSTYVNKGITNALETNDYVYFKGVNKLKVLQQGYNQQTLGYEVLSSSDQAIIFPPEHESFEKYILSLSFEGLRCDTPRTLNGD